MVNNINPKSVTGQSYINPVIERFKGSEKLFVAYLIDNKKELRHVFRLANRFKDIKFLIIPSKISEEILNINSAYHLVSISMYRFWMLLLKL